MQLFQINAINVSRDKFKLELEKNGLKYGYIPRLYEKFKQCEMTCFRLVIGDYQFVVVTDDESSYPEIQEETGKKIEPYSLEWLENLIYESNIIGPSFYESLLRHLQMYIRVKKSKKNDETEEQKNCPYCHGKKDDPQPKLLECNHKHADASIELGENFISFDNSDGHYMYGEFKINYCPICGRKLEEKA